MSDQRLAMDVCINFNIEEPPGATAEAFHAQGERVMNALLELEACDPSFTDSTVSTDSAEKTLLVELLVFAADEPSGLQKALDVVRAAAHTAGAATPGWPRIAVDEPATSQVARTRVPV